MTEFPRDWTSIRLGEVFEIGSSKRVFQSQWRSSGVPFYRARDIVGFINGEDAVGGLYIDPSLYEEYKRAYGVPKIDDLLVTAVGTLGKVYRVTDNHPFYFKDGNIIWFKSKGEADSRYVEQLFVSGLLDDQIFDTAGGSTVGTYTITSANRTLVVLPPLPEQRRIANALGAVDKLIDNLTRRIEKKRLVKQGVMQELLTGKKRLPGFRGEWKLLSFADLYKGAAEGGTPDTSRPEYYTPPTIPFVRIEDTEEKYLTKTFSSISKMGLDNSPAWLVPKGSILFTNGATIGNVTITKMPVATKQGILGIVLDKNVDLEFAYYLFKSCQFQKKVLEKQTIGTFATVILRNLDAIPVSLPLLEEQRAIAAILSNMDAEIAKLEAKREKYIHIKQGMMNDLLTGKVRI